MGSVCYIILKKVAGFEKSRVFYEKSRVFNRMYLFLSKIHSNKFKPDAKDAGFKMTAFSCFGTGDG